MLLLKRIRGLFCIHNQRELSDAEREKMANLHQSADRCIERMTVILQRQNAFHDWLQTIDDAQIRLLLTLRYMDGLQWDEIQESMPQCISDRHGSAVMKRVQRFMKTLPKQDDFFYVFPDDLDKAGKQHDIVTAMNQQRAIIRVSAFEEGDYDE